MTACGVQWCVEDHGVSWDDEDGRGSHMHRGEVDVYRLSDDETNTYSRDDVEAYVTRWDDATGVPARAALTIPGAATMTAAELRDLAMWLAGLAGRLEHVNREAVPSLAR